MKVSSVVMASCDNCDGEYNEYFHELNDIKQDAQPDETLEEELSKSPVEGEQEVQWLQDAGYGHLVSKIEVGEELDAELLEKETQELTAAQLAAVKKRLDTVKSTCKKHHKSQRTDVRKVFNQEPADSSVSQPKTNSKSSVSSGSSTSHGHQPRKTTTSYRTSLLRHRGEYSMTGNASAVVDGMGSPGISMLYIHSSDSTVANNGVKSQSKLDPTDGGNHQVNNVLKLFNTSNFMVADNDLPDVIPMLDTTGLTNVNDLGKKDLAHVHYLAFLDLTALYDQWSISFMRRKAKGHGRDTGLFGVDLEVLLEHDQKKCSSLRVPLIFYELIKYLEATTLHEEGLLRVPGSTTRIKTLRQELESQYRRGKFSFTDVTAHDAATLLKQLLRELPTPLLTFEYLEAFTKVDKISDLATRVKALNYLVLALPDVHCNTLQMLLSFLKAVVDADGNKMTLGSVAMIMAPNLFLVGSIRSAGGARRTPKLIKDLMEVSMAAGISNIVQLMIKYQDILWQVPASLMSQIRLKNQIELQKSRENRFLKRLGKKDKAELTRKSSSAQDMLQLSNVIRVSAPELCNCLKAIPLHQLLTAADVLEKFSLVPELTTGHETSSWDSNSDELENRARNASPNPSIHLYEVGGNIGERRLDRGANIMSLYEVNPNAVLVVKKQPLY